MQDHNVKQLERTSVYANSIEGCMQGDSAGLNPRLCLEKIGEMKNLLFFFLSRSSRQKSIA